MNKLFFLLVFIFFVSCSNEPSLQKYFVAKSESKAFVSLDLGSSFINANEMNLSKSEKKALETFDKVNVLAFQKSKDADAYESEWNQVRKLLKNDKYEELIKLGSKNQSGSIHTIVDEKDQISEIVFLANESNTGFAVVRVLGDQMTPTQIFQILSIMQKSNLDVDQLKPLQNLLITKK